MDEPDVSSEVELMFTMAAAASCANTIAGWVWYCDAHDTHGNADSQEEARYIADAHVVWQNEDDEDDACDIWIAKKGSGDG